MMNVVIDRFGVTFAPGCVNENGRQDWALMQAKMRGNAPVKRCVAPAHGVCTKAIGDYSVPCEIASLFAAGVYQLLCWASENQPHFSSVTDACERAAIPRQHMTFRKQLTVLQGFELIDVQRDPRGMLITVIGFTTPVLIFGKQKV